MAPYLEILEHQWGPWQQLLDMQWRTFSIVNTSGMEQRDHPSYTGEVVGIILISPAHTLYRLHIYWL